MRNLFYCILMMATAQAGELRVLCYNIHHGRGMEGKLDLARIAEVIRKAKPDLVALQEVDIHVPRSGNVDTLAQLATSLNMQHAFGKTIDLNGGQYGNAILSKFPIMKQTVHKLPGKGETRAILCVDVKVNGKVLSFCSVHFDHQNEQVRLIQAKAMNIALEGIKHPVIVAGDLNAIPNSATMELVRKSWHVVPKQGSPFTVPADAPKREIDYIVTRNLIRNKAVSRVIEEPVASDHRPVLAIVEIPD